MVTVIVSAHAWPDALELMLRALADQQGPSFEVVVAEDGEHSGVAAVFDSWRGVLDLRHVSQPHEGFRKARAMNLAALEATGDLLVFLDGDCLPRRGFVEAIRRASLSGWFLATKRINLEQGFSDRVVTEVLPIWRWSLAEWLVRQPRVLRRPGYLVPARDRRRPWRPKQPEFEPPGASYCMIAVPRSHFQRVNGYDGRCVHWLDGEDQEIAIRLRRSGLRCGWPGPRATVFHLWHVNRREIAIDREPLFRQTRVSTHVEAAEGLRELAAATDG